MEGEEQGAVVETASPTVTDSTGQPTAQAPIQPVQPPVEPQVPFHQHPRFQQLIRDGQQSRQTIQQLQSQVEQYQAKFAELEKKSSQGQTSPEEEEELRKAGGALSRIYQRNPQLVRELLDSDPEIKALRENSAKLIAMQTGMTQMQQAQSQQALRTAVSHVQALAKQHSIPDDPESLRDLLPMIAARAKSIEGGEERFNRGDLSVLDEAFNQLNTQGIVRHLQRASTERLIDTKQRTTSLPPVARGGAAGPPGIPKFDPTKDSVRDQLGRFQKAAVAMMTEGGRKE